MQHPNVHWAATSQVIEMFHQKKLYLSADVQRALELAGKLERRSQSSVADEVLREGLRRRIERPAEMLRVEEPKR